MAASGQPFGRLAVIGGGAWGTALAVIACQAGREVTLWVREREARETIARTGQNEVFLPGVALPESLTVVGGLQEALEGAEAALLVVPSQFFRGICDNLNDRLPRDLPLLIAGKGIERESGLLLSQVAEQVLPGHPIAVLSGPTFAGEAAKGLPTAVVIACEDQALAERFAASLGTKTFRPYLSDDLIGVQVGGAVKNVIAIACGIATGIGFGANTRAALITRGLAEIMRLAVELGGRPETLSGLAGLGDLSLTCSSEQSRNFTLGEGLGRGLPRAEIFAGRPVVAEGEENARSVRALAARLGVEMPICEAVADLLDGELALDEAIQGLLSRPLKQEVR